MTKLTTEQQNYAVMLANLINCELVDPDAVVTLCQVDKKFAKKIIPFWYEFSEITQQALDTLTIHKTKQVFEYCLTKDADGYSELEK